MKTDPHLLSLDMKIKLAEILDEQNEWAQLVAIKRNWLIDQVLKTPDIEKDYFEDETD